MFCGHGNVNQINKTSKGKEMPPKRKTPHPEPTTRAKVTKTAAKKALPTVSKRVQCDSPLFLFFILVLKPSILSIRSMAKYFHFLSFATSSYFCLLSIFLSFYLSTFLPSYLPSTISSSLLVDTTPQLPSYPSYPHQLSSLYYIHIFKSHGQQAQFAKGFNHHFQYNQPLQP